MVTKVLFVCMGNICRSPMAQGIFEKLVNDYGLAREFEIDSAGTHNYHEGERPDERAQAITKLNDCDISKQKARVIEDDDFETFDHILVMDKSNLQCLHSICPKQHRHKIELFLIHAKEYLESEVPDPYYGGEEGFQHVLDLVTAAGKGFLGTLHPEKMASVAAQEAVAGPR